MLRRALDRLFDASGVLAGACLVAIFAVVLAQVTGRQLGFQVPGADNLAGWFCAATAFLGLAHTFQRGEMVRVAVLVDRLPPPAARACEVAVLVLATAFIAFVHVSALRYCWESFRIGELPQSGTLALPLWIPQSSFAIGSLLLALALLDNLVCALRGGIPAYRRHARSELL